MADDFSGVRRLPVYLLLDCSGSMAGEPIAALEMGVRTLLGDLRNDPQALETVCLSVITFASSAESIVSLTALEDFHTPALIAGGSTALGHAFELLAERIAVEVRTTRADRKGDWKPLVFVLTDGSPTDDWEKPLEDFRLRGLATLIACGAGPEVNEAMLLRLGDRVVRLKDTQPGTLGAFMKWMSASVAATTRSLGTHTRPGEQLPEAPEQDGIRVLR